MDKGLENNLDYKVGVDVELNVFKSLRRIQEQLDLPNISPLCLQYYKGVCKFQDLGYNYIEVNKMALTTTKQHFIDKLIGNNNRDKAIMYKK